MQYGLQRLVLLNSAGYQRAELPLDQSVSLVAPNNTGKTSLINALQFLLIVDRRRMDFGAHDVDKSRRFYFPSNSSCILLEASLPESGTIVLGCIGKGVSHDYEYFAYRGQLDINDYRMPDGQLVNQPLLKQQLGQHGKLVFAYNSSEFAEMLYGGRRKRTAHEPDFCLFRLEHSSDASAFQRVLTRTLRLDRLRSKEVKEYLLQIFRRDLPDANIDFKQEWDKAFAEVNAERAQYDAALRQQDQINELEQRQQQRKTLRGKIACHKPMIEAGLQQWEGYYQTTLTERQTALQDFHRQSGLLRERDRTLAQQQSHCQQQLHQLSLHNARQSQLEQRFALLADRTTLQTRLAESRQHLEAQIALLSQIDGRDPAVIRHALQRNQQEWQQLQRERATLADNLYQQLADKLSAEQLETLNRTINREVMTLGSADFQVDLTKLQQTLDSGQPMPGLRLPLDKLTAQHHQRGAAELDALLADLQRQQQTLKQQLQAALELESAQQRKRSLESDVRAIEADLAAFDEMLALQAAAAERAKAFGELTDQLHAIQAELALAESRADSLLQQSRELDQAITRLQAQHQQIAGLRGRRLDGAAQFSYLQQLPHDPWIGEAQFQLEELASRLAQYQDDCRSLLSADSVIEHLLISLHGGGLTKYLALGSSEDEISHIVEFGRHLPQEQEALEKKARSAVVNVTLCLRQLRDGLRIFNSRMREFNRLINRRQLSDLAVFNIRPQDETELVEAIDLLIDTAEQVETGSSFELFNQRSVLDDARLERAKTLLIDEGNARHGLRIDDLFRLGFEVGKDGQSPESYDDLDSAASNGTVLMAKLITGLAMLHLMQDKRRPVQAVCYLDEALALDARNQKNLIDTAAEFGFALIFASPSPLTTARYCVPITRHDGHNHISRKSWQILEPLT